MNIWSTLKQRAALTRPTRVQNPATGAWTNTYRLIATNVRFQYVPSKGWQTEQNQTVDSLSESSGFAIFHPSQDIQPGDRLNLMDARTFTVGSRGGLQSDGYGHSSHQEWEVEQA